MKLIQTLVIENELFYICKNDDGYWGINNKYVDDGMLKEQINGLQGNFSDNYLTTVRHCWLSVKRKYLPNYEDDIQAWRLAFEKIEDEFDSIGISDIWKKSKNVRI